jgi:DNA-binding transcriptional MerR regulator
MQQYNLMVRSISSDELTLDHLAACAEMHPEVVARLVEFGLLQPIESSGNLLLFDPSKIRRLLSIKRLRSELGINLEGVAVVLDLVERLQTLERENAWLRARL